VIGVPGFLRRRADQLIRTGDGRTTLADENSASSKRDQESGRNVASNQAAADPRELIESQKDEWKTFPGTAGGTKRR
jgi:hypothetical protein